MAVEENAAPTDHDSANAGGFSDVPDHAAGATSGAAARFRPATIKCPHHPVRLVGGLRRRLSKGRQKGEQCFFEQVAEERGNHAGRAGLRCRIFPGDRWFSAVFRC